MELNLNININNSKKFKINFLLILILLFATFLRFYHLGFQNAWLDEIHTLKESDPNLTFAEFHQVIMFREGIPHFYFLIIKYASQVIGIHNIYLCRLLSVISGILSVYFIYLLGSKLFTKNTGYIPTRRMSFPTSRANTSSTSTVGRIEINIDGSVYGVNYSNLSNSLSGISFLID